MIRFTVKEPAELTCSIDGLLKKNCHSPLALAGLADGGHRFELTAVDQVGNSGQAALEFAVDTVAPSLTLTAAPPSKSADRRPAFGFAANEPAAFACSIDGAAAQPCASPFLAPDPLADGGHGFGVVATDQAGNVATAAASFAIDTRPPRTFVAAGPRRMIRTRKGKVRVTFRFGADEAGVSFVCRVDRGPLRSCPARMSRRFGAGPTPSASRPRTKSATSTAPPPSSASASSGSAEPAPAGPQRSRSARPEWRPPPSSRRTAAPSAAGSPTRTQPWRARVIAV